MNPDATSSFDVLIVGAGLSGIGAAVRLQAALPDASVAILEARQAIGGTWDLFRYPGVRSDSDMFTLGYGFRPWDSDRAITDGPSIRRYIEDTAREYGVDRRIRHGHRVTEARWDSSCARWSVTVAIDGQPQPLELSCRFLYLCTGYYDYAQGHDPHWPGEEQFGGAIVRPQHWPEGLPTAGRRIVVVGSGATAVTLVPELARDAAHVTMLQRSPTYIVSLPAVDRIAVALRRVLPRHTAHRLVRFKNVLLQSLLYRHARRHPRGVRRFIVEQARKQLPAGFDVAQHFTPRYDPWDQRLCLVPDGDLFGAVREGRASVVTDHIERVLPQGLLLRSGRVLEADVLVKATGLKMKLAGGIRLAVDGRPVDLARAVTYKGMMYGGVPNLAAATGYINASWTLKCELIAGYVCRLLQHLREGGFDYCVPEPPAVGTPLESILELSSGYVERARAELPRQGPARPWRMNQSYWKDLADLRFARLDDGVMRFGHAARSGDEHADARPARHEAAA